MKKIRPALVLGIALLIGSATAARAIAINLTNIAVTAHSSGSGLLISTAALPPPNPINLTDNAPFTFDLFDIWTDETAINADDLVGKAITVQLTFDIGQPPVIGGTTDGYATWISFIQIQYGDVSWNGQPTTFAYQNKYFDISLSSENFNGFLYSLKPGRDHGATVEATITQRPGSNVPGTAVPDACSTALLLGVTLAGIICSKRRLE